jgi:hypothetical protein
LSGKATNLLFWLRSAQPIACATEPRAWLSLRQAGASASDIPRLSTPERTERWTWVVACAHNLLVLARPLVDGCYRPWETRRAQLTLAQVRRAMPTLLHELGTPARPPQQRGKAPGRAKGFHPKPRTRHAVIRKTSKKPKMSKKAASA